MEEKKRKKLSKAEKKRLYICTERAFDLVKRMEEMIDILRKKEWADADILLSLQSSAVQIYRRLGYIDQIQYMLEKRENERTDKVY